MTSLRLRANQIYRISAWQSQWRHRLWRRELHMNLQSRVSAAPCGPRCLVTRPHYFARQSVSGRVVPAKWIDREGLGKRCTGTSQRSTYIHVHFSRNTNFDKIIISLLRWLASRGIIEVKVTDNDKKNCTKFTWYLNFHQNLRSPHYLTSVGKSPELSWQGCRPCAVLPVIAVWFLKLIPDQRPQVVNKRYSVFSSSSTANGFSCWPLQHNFGCCFLWVTGLFGPFI